MREVYYYVRHPDVEIAKSNFDRVVLAAEGAATGTGTEVEYEVIHGLYSMLPNYYVGRLLEASLREVGGYSYTPEEESFAAQIVATLAEPGTIGSQEQVRDWVPTSSGGSTDVADVSWVVPTAQFRAATWVPGTPSHSWQAVAAGGMSIGTNGMMIAAKTLARTAVEIFSNPDHVKEGLAELERQRGDGFRYESLVGDREPPLGLPREPVRQQRWTMRKVSGSAKLHLCPSQRPRNPRYVSANMTRSTRNPLSQDHPLPDLLLVI